MARQVHGLSVTRRWRPWWAPAVVAACSAAWAGAPPDEPEPVPPQQSDAAQDDEEDLSEKLIRQATGQRDRGIMDEIMRLMDRSARLLTREFDPGKRTQDVQQQIIDKLDQAIAAAQRRRSRSSISVRPRGDKRTTPPEPAQSQDADQARSGDQPPDATVPGPGEPQQSAVGGRFRESRRGWGNLPARDRDEVLQGIDEDVLEKYRSLIENYFRALAEDDQE